MSRISPHHTLRLLTDFGQPHEKAAIRARDGVMLSGTLLKRGLGKTRCVLMLNSAARSRHQLGMVLLAEWLVDCFDVASFDMRGHFDSGGSWSPVEAVKDVQDLVESLRARGYQKIGVFGKSLGAWSAILNAALNNSSDSVAALSSPLEKLQLNHRLQRYIEFYLAFPKNIRKQLFQRIARVSFDSLESVYSLSHEAVQTASTPLLFMYYQTDPMLGITSKDARNVFDSLSGPKRFVELHGVGHGIELESLKMIACELNSWFEQTL